MDLILTVSGVGMLFCLIGMMLFFQLGGSNLYRAYRLWKGKLPTWEERIEALENKVFPDPKKHKPENPEGRV